MPTKVNTEQQTLESPPMEGQARASSARTGLGELSIIDIQVVILQLQTCCNFYVYFFQTKGTPF